jgi:hypothetical protein
VTFIRFKNAPSNKLIGFSFIDSKTKVLKWMLNCIINFTMPDSYTNLVYISKNNIYTKRYVKMKNENNPQYSLNGHCFSEPKSAFPTTKNKKQFMLNLKDVFMPESI